MSQPLFHLLFYNALYNDILYSTNVYCTVLKPIMLYYIVLYCNIFQCTIQILIFPFNDVVYCIICPPPSAEGQAQAGQFPPHNPLGQVWGEPRRGVGSALPCLSSAFGRGGGRIIGGDRAVSISGKSLHPTFLKHSSQCHVSV